MISLARTKDNLFFPDIHLFLFNIIIFYNWVSKYLPDIEKELIYMYSITGDSTKPYTKWSWQQRKQMYDVDVLKCLLMHMNNLISTKNVI